MLYGVACSMGWHALWGGMLYGRPCSVAWHALWAGFYLPFPDSMNIEKFRYHKHNCDYRRVASAVWRWRRLLRARRRYGGAGLGGVLGTVLVVVLVFWLVGAFRLT